MIYFSGVATGSSGQLDLAAAAAASWDIARPAAKRNRRTKHPVRRSKIDDSLWSNQYVFLWKHVWQSSDSIFYVIDSAIYRQRKLFVSWLMIAYSNMIMSTTRMHHKSYQSIIRCGSYSVVHLLDRLNVNCVMHSFDLPVLPISWVISIDITLNTIKWEKWTDLGQNIGLSVDFFDPV